MAEETYKKESESLPTPHEQNSKHASWYKRFCNWLKCHNAKLYLNTRDLADPFGIRKNDPFDLDDGSDGKTSYEAGIKITF